ncbi:MAG: polyketide cyclase [Nocardioidaceae bacterium]|nr:polyketide cyclase [Nocardioidaceae bacterium]
MTNDNSITVQRQIPASAREIFDVLSLPSRHPELDGSGFVRSVEQADRITSTGQSFRMNMTGDHMGGDYQTDNHVTGFQQDQLLAWKTAPADADPPGWQWVWTLKPESSDVTQVSLTYDWSQVVDPEILSKVSFPLVSQRELEDSLNNLAAATSGA